MTADNLAIATGTAGLALVVFYYALAWVRVRRPGGIPPRIFDPARWTAAAQDVSPAAARFLLLGACDGASLRAVVTALAEKSCLSIIRNGAHAGVIRAAAANRAALAPEERAAADILLREERRSDLDDAARRELLFSVREVLEGRWLPQLRARAWGTLFSGAALSAGVLSAMKLAACAGGRPRALDALTALASGLAAAAGGGALSLLWASAYRAWTGAFAPADTGKPDPRAKFPALALAAAAIFAAWAAGNGFPRLLGNGSPLLAPLGAGLLLVNALFFYLLRAPSEEGWRALAAAKGLREHLAAHKSGIANHLLPYAVALDTGHVWPDDTKKLLSDVDALLAD